MKFMLIFIALLFGVVARAHAMANLVIDSVTVEGDNYKISYTLSGWSSGDMGRSGCGQGDGSCHVFQTLTTSNSNYSSIILSIPLSSGIDRYLTLGQVILRLNDSGFFMPYRGSYLLTGEYSLEGSCLVIHTAGSRGRSAPVTDCVALRAPAPVVQCYVGGSTAIDHKTLSNTALSGAQASTKLNLSCTGAASVTVKATRTNSYGVKLKSDDSLYSEIKVNDKDATSGINLFVANNMNYSLNITSTLKVRGVVTPGRFSGSTVIIVSPN
ncbi:hypothetical protein [Pseudomonas lactis]|uniref:MrpH family fimbial adhesin n=1 Tax=Pseudomonas lactis TaxID=1615674 RepID=UPI001476219D|nr:hypothetical protein [Pseudomonas lactis]NNA54014.1 hypothetical protein [Pseudomonas lactis]